jgi:hypothetical protein
MLDRETMLADNRLGAALALARRRELPIPKPVVAAEATLDELRRLQAQPDPPVPTLPARADAIEAAFVAAANQRANVAAVRAMAAESVDVAATELSAAVKNSLAGWIDGLAENFATELVDFREAAASAPNVSADALAGLAPVAFEAWQTATRCALSLDLLVEDRRLLAQAFGENPATRLWGHALPLIAVLKPHVGDREDLGDAFRARAAELKSVDALTDSSSRWRGWVSAEDRGLLRLSLAGPAEVGPRVALVESWRVGFDALLTRAGGVELGGVLAGAENTWRILATVGGA